MVPPARDARLNSTGDRGDRCRTSAKLELAGGDRFGTDCPCGAALRRHVRAWPLHDVNGRRKQEKAWQHGRQVVAGSRIEDRTMQRTLKATIMLAVMALGLLVAPAIRAEDPGDPGLAKRFEYLSENGNS